VCDEGGLDIVWRKTLKRVISNRTIWRWGFLVSIGLAEVTWLAIRIEAPPTGLLSYAKGLPAIFITSLAVVVVLAWARYRGKLLELPIFEDIPHRSWPMVLAQVAAFAVFSWVTISVFENDVTSSTYAALWIVAWAATGFATGLFWLLAAMPARAWIRLARENSSLVSAGMAIIATSWVLGYLANRAWGSLQGSTLLAVQWLLQGFHQDVVCPPVNHLVGTSRFSVDIAPACAGYEGIGLMAVFVCVYFWLFRKTLRFPQALILLPFAIMTIWLANAVRITSLILVGTYVSPEIALGGFHSATGWLDFIAVALGLVAVTQRIRFFAAESELRARAEAGVMGTVEGTAKDEIVPEAKGVNPTAAYVGPLMALLAITMITGVFTSRFDWLYPARVLGTANSVSRLNLARTFSWSAVGVGAAVFVIWMLLEKVWGEPDTGLSIANNLGKVPYGLAAAWLIFRVLGSVVTVPIAEELAFRGYVLRRLLSADFEKVSTPQFTWLSFLGSSILFGALHGRWLAGTLAGMFYAWAMYRRGRVADAIVAHATTNALIAMSVLILGNWGLWK
jgi:exosortase E/protease (VPEID-CTERM system)